jgi:hypothetical protein
MMLPAISLESKYFAKQTVTFGYGMDVSRFHSTEAPADMLHKSIKFVVSLVEN